MIAADWQNLIKRIRSKELNSATWQSDQQSLIGIFCTAQVWDLDPTYAAAANLSKLREIIPIAKEVIDQGDPDELSHLFEMAATSNMIELRLKLGKRTPEEIKVWKRTHGKVHYVVELNEKQLNRIKKSTRLFFNFVENEG